MAERVESPSDDGVSYAPFPGFTEWARATPFDSTSFASYHELLQEARERAPEEDQAAALDVATRTAAVDTGAIEGLYETTRGFTLTVATKTANWEAVIAAKGEVTLRAIEDALAAYELVLDAATQSRGPITEVWIRQLHATACSSQETYTVYTDQGPQDQELPKGQYKKYENSPMNLETGRIHRYASVLDTPPEMARVVQELGSEDFLSAHPVLQAAYAHYAFVCVHPFGDGNGRVARALASVFLYRVPGVPLVIFADQKNRYLDSLEAADRGMHALFVRFVAERAIDAVQMVRQEMEAVQARRVQENALRALSASLESGLGLTHLEIDAIGARIHDALQASFQTHIGQLELPQGVQFQISNHTGLGGNLTRSGFRPIHSALRVMQVQLSSSPPAPASKDRQFTVLIARPDMDTPLFLISSTDGLVLELALDEVNPSISGAAEWRIARYVETVVASLTAALAVAVDDALRKAGYR